MSEGFDTFWPIYQHLHAIALVQLPMRPEIQLIVSHYGNVEEAGENQGFPLITHERIGDFGLGGIPQAIVIEEMLQAV